MFQVPNKNDKTEWGYTSERNTILVTRVRPNTFASSARKKWNHLSDPIKTLFKEYINKFLRSAEKQLETSEFVYF